MNPIPIRNRVRQSFEVRKGLLAAQGSNLEGEGAKFRRTEHPRYVANKVGMRPIRGNNDTSHRNKSDAAKRRYRRAPLRGFTAEA